jgi:hypothetical protein
MPHQADPFRGKNKNRQTMMPHIKNASGNVADVSFDKNVIPP